MSFTKLYGLEEIKSWKQLRCKVHQYPESLICFSMPNSWSRNARAGPDWLSCFRKRHPFFALKKPTSNRLDQVRKNQKHVAGAWTDNVEACEVNPTNDVILPDTPLLGSRQSERVISSRRSQYDAEHHEPDNKSVPQQLR